MPNNGDRENRVKNTCSPESAKKLHKATLIGPKTYSYVQGYVGKQMTLTVGSARFVRDNGMTDPHVRKYSARVSNDKIPSV